MASRDIINIAKISILGTIFDYVITHKIIFHNNPDLLQYFISIKLIPSFIIIYLVYYLFKNYSRFDPWKIGVPTGIIIFVAFVQAYYGFYPVPMADGTFVHITLADSFKNGYIHHFLDFFISFLIINKWYRS